MIGQAHRLAGLAAALVLAAPAWAQDYEAARSVAAAAQQAATSNQWAAYHAASRWQEAYDSYAQAARLAPRDEAPRISMVQAYDASPADGTGRRTIKSSSLYRKTRNARCRSR